MDELYREELMDLYRHPQHAGTLSQPSVSVDQHNRFCGDHLHLSLTIQNQVITQAKFSGQSCMVSTVASEILLDFIQNKTLAEAKTITKEKLLSLLNLNLTTSRIACATLILDALQHAITEYEQTI